jgi:hypothetical protein
MMGKKITKDDVLRVVHREQGHSGLTLVWSMLGGQFDQSLKPIGVIDRVTFDELKQVETVPRLARGLVNQGLLLRKAHIRFGDQTAKSAFYPLNSTNTIRNYGKISIADESSMPAKSAKMPDGFMDKLFGELG